MVNNPEKKFAYTFDFNGSENLFAVVATTQDEANAKVLAMASANSRGSIVQAPAES